MNLYRRLEAIEDWIDEYPLQSIMSDREILKIGEEFDVDGPTFVRAFVSINPCRILNINTVHLLGEAVELAREMGADRDA